MTDEDFFEAQYINWNPSKNENTIRVWFDFDKAHEAQALKVLGNAYGNNRTCRIFWTGE